MSRFIKFQNKQILNERNEPLNEQIVYNGCIINFEHGYIHNRYEESSDKPFPAIECIDAHIEYWEKGLLHKNDKPAVISVGDNIVEFWEKGKNLKEKKGRLFENNDEENFKIGIEAEKNFANYLNENNIPFIHLDQQNKQLYSKALINKNSKRPDYIIFLDKVPHFIDIKAISCYTINQNELNKLNALENEFLIKVALGIIDKDESKTNKYSFITLENITNYVKLYKEKYSNNYIFNISKLLFSNNIVSNKVEKHELSEIVNIESKKNGDNFYQYSDALKEYIKERNYTIKEYPDCSNLN